MLGYLGKLAPGALQRCVPILVGFVLSACAAMPNSTEAQLSANLASPPKGLVSFCIRYPLYCIDPERVDAVGLLDTEPTGGLTARGAWDSEPASAAIPSVMRGVPLMAGDPNSPLILDHTAASVLPTYGAKFQLTDGGQPKTQTKYAAIATADKDAPKMNSDDVFKLLRSVNDTINRKLRPQTDMEIYGVSEYWTLPLTFGESLFGDCEDYVLEKRRELIARGISATQLFMAVVHSEKTGRHAVLVYRGEKGDVVLDNMTGMILPWHLTYYTWIKRQVSGDNAMQWAYFATS